MKALALVMLIATSASASPAADIPTQVKEAFALAEGMKMAVADYAAEHNAFPANNEEARLPAATLIQGRYVAQSAVDGSKMTFEFGPGSDASIQSKHLTMVGQLTDGKVSWSCQSEDLPASACPADCSCPSPSASP